MAAAPVVTIAVPSYNQGRFLDQALTSIFEQYLPVEVFVADGYANRRIVVVVGHAAEWVTKTLHDQLVTEVPVEFVEQRVQRGPTRRGWSCAPLRRPQRELWSFLFCRCGCWMWMLDLGC